MVDYIIDKKKDTQIVASEGLYMENLETIAMSFNAQSRMNDKVTKPVGHIAVSYTHLDVYKRQQYRCVAYPVCHTNTHKARNSIIPSS